METAQPQLATNWRWQMCLLRTYYDMYVRERLAYEADLEVQANAALAEAPSVGADVAMANAQAILDLATSAPVRADLRTRIVDLCDDLFSSIGLQTSTSAPFYAKNAERGCVLDFLDHPLNNRWWLEDQFAIIGALATEGEKLAAIDVILNWEDPGTGGFYDDLGNGTKEPHLVQQYPWDVDPGYVDSTQDEFAWNKFTQRLSWQDQAQTLFGTPLEVEYTGLEPAAQYRVQVLYTGRFHATMSLTADSTYVLHGALAQPATPQVLEYVVPMAATADGTLHLQWDLYYGRGCQVGELWLTRD